MLLSIHNADLLVSVIVPVYNAEKFIEEAVLSAVYLEEVGEIILVEDGSKDNSLEKCKELKSRFSKIKLITHENNLNKGVSASRNVGIRAAAYSIISFLDADDRYCPNRFTKDISILKANPSIDGCYSSVRYIDEINGKAFTLLKTVSPNKLFHFLLRGKYGHFHTNGITLKKNVFDAVGYFNTQLPLHQDTEMWLRISFTKKLVGSELSESVALIRKHEGNRIWVGQSNKTKYSAYSQFYKWVIDKKIKKIDLFLLVRKISLLEHKIKGTNYYLLLLKKIIKAFLKQH